MILGCCVKKELWIVLLAFLGGIVVANLMDREFLTTYGIMNDYFLSQYSYQKVDGNRLFCHIAVERGKAAFTIFLLGRAIDNRLFSVLTKSAVAAMFGFLVVVSIVNLGVRGILVSVCGLFPQWIFYVIALVCCANERRGEVQSAWNDGRYAARNTVDWGNLLLAVFFLLVGMLAESYVNPIFLSCLLKII